jgi:sulfate/thiosulfate transport system permease protein
MSIEVSARAIPAVGRRGYPLGRWLLIGAVLGWFALLILVPTVALVRQAFAGGLGPFVAALTAPEVRRPFALTLGITVLATAVNTVFGLAFAVVLVRHKFWGRALADGLVDLPFAVSPVVVGLALVLLFGSGGWFGDLPFQVIFSVPGMVLATIFVSMPFVVREVTPVLRELGDEQEQAAATLGASRWTTFRRITLPAIRWGLAYGVVLSTARAIGEFGAVSVVSSKVAGETQTLTLLVEQRFQNFDLAGAYAASALLALIALVTLLVLTVVKPRKEHT